MPLPPKGDPRRPLHLAIRSMRLLGGLLLLFATCATVPFAMRAWGAAGAGVLPVWYVAMALLVYLVPGTCFIVFSIYLGRRQFWAVVASICLASIACLFALFALASVLMVVMIGRDFHPAMLIPLAFVLLLIVALGQLIYHLGRSFEAIRHAPPEERGFEPIMRVQ